MRTILYAALAAAALASSTGPVSAQTTVIERDEPAVVVRERPTTVIERREVTPVPPPVTDCETKTVTRSDGVGNSTTVHKERCD